MNNATITVYLVVILIPLFTAWLQVGIHRKLANAFIAFLFFVVLVILCYIIGGIITGNAMIDTLIYVGIINSICRFTPCKQLADVFAEIPSPLLLFRPPPKEETLPIAETIPLHAQDTEHEIPIVQPRIISYLSASQLEESSYEECST
jgi:hypothetical protein